MGDKWTEFNWPKAAKIYGERVKYLYGTIRVLGNPKPVQLEGIFTDVRILSKPSALQRFNIEELKKQFSENRHFQTYAKRHDELGLISQPESHRLFILGKPGAGKTTFLKYIALQAINGHISKIPIFVSLKEWSDSKLDLLPFIVRQFEICAFPDGRPFIERLLNSGQAIVLFDGLDEVNQAGNLRNDVITDLNNFSKQYHSAQCLITCRIAATDYSFEHFTYVEMADFNNEQMRTFVKKWFPDNNVQDKFFAEFFKSENEGLRELGRIPLLLTLLCLSFEETLAFPQRRVEIYEEALDALLKKWDSSRKIKRDEAYRKLSLGRKRQLLARIAAETFDESEYFLRQKKLEKQIVNYLRNLPPTDVNEDVDGEAILRSIEAQHGVLVERARQIYSFSHLSLQEYFTAKYIVDNAAKGTLEALIGNHLTDTRWREVFLNTASLLDDADEFFVLLEKATSLFIVNDERLIKILKWVGKKAEEVDVQLKPSVLRGIYSSLVIATSGSALADYEAAAFANTFKNPGLNSESNVNHVIKFAYELSKYRRQFTRGLITPVELAIKSIQFYLEQTIDNILALEISLTNLLNLTLLLSKINDFDEWHEMPVVLGAYLDSLIDLIQHSDNYSDLEQTLNKLRTPSKNAPQTAWERFAGDLQDTISTHLDIGYEWNLTTNQALRFRDYFRGNQLLVECLELAYVSDRVRLENNLLVLPEGAS